MIECKKVFVDTAPFIYCIEESKDNPRYYNMVQGFFEACYRKDIVLVTSTITLYDKQLRQFGEISVVTVDKLSV